MPSLRHASRSLLVRTIRRRARHVLLAPFTPLIAREPGALVHVPPLDAQILSALKLIAPQYTSLRSDEASRIFWQRDQNSACESEADALGALFAAMPPPARILELGPGLGRSAVYLSKRFFPAARFDLFDATGSDTKYELMGSRHEDSFCGNLDVLRRCLEFNGVRNVRILDASATGGHVPSPPEGTYDLIYSFYAVGFHWSLDHWLDEILSVCHDRTLCVFTVPSHYEPSARIAATAWTILQASAAIRPHPLNVSYYLAFTPKPAPWLETK